MATDPDEPQRPEAADDAESTPRVAASGRRGFLRGSLAHLGMLTLAAGKGRVAHAAQDGLIQRRHLITIQPVGPSGYDAQSFHFGLQPKSMARAKVRTDELKNLPPEFEVGPHDWTPRDTPGMSGFVHPSYPAHPDVYLGPGMSIFRDTTLLADTIQIVGGLEWRDGGHVVGVEVLNSGQRGAYAPCFSSLIARSTGEKRPLPLHYVQLAQPRKLATHVGLLGGIGEPVMIPDFKTLRLITQLDPKSDLPETRRGVLDDAVAGLVDAALGARLRLATSRELYHDYFGAFQRAVSLMTSNLTAPDSDFMQLWDSYTQDVKDVVDKHPFWTRVRDRPGLKTDVDVPTLAFRFALAEYLVAMDMSTVVDIGVPFHDAHTDNWGETATLLAIYACYRRLLLNLRVRRAISGGVERGLLELTTVAMFSEFDRTACMTGGQGPRFGTGHGPAASLMLAGMGATGGTVIGAIKAGPGQGPLPGLERGVGAALPVNEQTGRADENGKQYLLENFFPTLMSIFDTAIPGHQVTRHGPINLRVKAGV